MKKLLSLVLVLAVASLASAVIMSPMKIVDQGAGLFGIEFVSGLTVANDGPSGGMLALIGADGSAAYVTGPATSYDGAMAFMVDSADLGMAPGAVAGITTTGTMVNTAAGVYLAGYKALPGVNQLQLWRLDDSAAPLALVDTFVIPEPATMLILSLGGLLLRKKA